MGVAKANATNAAQGWRGDRPAREIKPKIEEPTMAMHKDGEGTCGGAGWQKRSAGNSYRAKHDDGSRKSRRSAGGQSRKHTSPTTKG